MSSKEEWPICLSLNVLTLQPIPTTVSDTVSSWKIRQEYRKISYTRCTKSQNLFSSRLAVVFAQSIEARC